MVVAAGCCWLSLAVIGCHWLSLAVIGCHWLLLAVIGCYDLLFLAVIFTDLKRLDRTNYCSPLKHKEVIESLCWDLG